MKDTIWDVLGVARLLDHAVLHPTSGERETVAGCEMGRENGVAAVCIKPCFTSAASKVLAGSPTKVCAVTAFPHGNSKRSVKVAEICAALDDGALEIDAVINNGLVCDGDWLRVAEEVRDLQRACARGGALLKVIFETDFLNLEQIRRLAEICREEGVGYVKTSTGFGYVRRSDGVFHTRGATEEAVREMVRICLPQTQVKASGGIRTLDDVLRFHALGCSRIGVSATEAILAEASARVGGGTGPIFLVKSEDY